MYTDDLKISSRYAAANKVFFEAVTKNSNNSSRHDDSISTIPYMKYADMVMESVMTSKNIRDKNKRKREKNS